MENATPKEENIIKDIRNPFKLKIELYYTVIEDIRKAFRQTKNLTHEKFN